MTPGPTEAALPSGFVHVLGWALLHTVWQASIIGIWTAAALATLRRATPQARYCVSYGGLLLTLAAPCATVFRQFGTAHAWPFGVAEIPRLAALGAVSAALAPWLPLLVAAWLVGVCALSFRFVAGWRALQRLKSASRPVAQEWSDAVTRLSRRLRVSRPVRVLQSSLAEVPCVAGWMRPMILLPVSALSGLTPAQLEAILAHELAHVRRGDYAMNLVQMVVETLLFYHPAVWWMSRRVRAERECCCDRAAVEACGNALEYARALTAMERLRLHQVGPVLAASGGHLLSRVREVTSLTGTRADQPPLRLSVAMAASLALVVCAGASAAGGASLQVAPALPATIVMGALLGFLVGLRHAFEPDHLMTLATLVTSERDPAGAARLGASWGVGHALALTGVAAGLTLIKGGMPGSVTRLFEVGVSVTLMAVGARAVRIGLQRGSQGPNHVHSHGGLTHRHAAPLTHLHLGPWTFARRPLLIGVLHGLAGSGWLTALVMATLPSASIRLAFILVFGLGSTTAMAILSGCAGWPLARLGGTPRAVSFVSIATGLVSVAFGLAWILPLIGPWLR